MVSRGADSGWRDPWGIEETERAAPPVFGVEAEPSDEPDTATPETVEAPANDAPVPVYVPVRPLAAEHTHAEVELRHTTDGQIALPVYSSVDTLAECAGPYQPWIAIPADEVEGIAQTVEANAVVVDTAIPQQQWHTGGNE